MKSTTTFSMALLIFLNSCSEHQSNKLTLVCTGIETTTAGRNNSEKSEPDTRNVSKTIIVEEGMRKIIKGIKVVNDINRPEQGNRIEEIKKVFILKINDSKELYEQSTIDIFHGKTTSYDSAVSVSNEKISGSNELNIRWENRNKENSSDSLSIEIDRISGVYKERIQQSFQSGKEVFFVETIGNCHKAEQKF